MRPSARPQGLIADGLAAVIRDGMFRKSEATALAWVDVDAGPGGSGRLTVRRSKPDPKGSGALGRGAVARYYAE